MKLTRFNFMKFTRVALGVVVLFFSSEALSVVLKFSTLMPEESTYAEVVKRFSYEIERRTGGRLKIVTYYGGVLGDEPDMVRLMKLGQLHGGLFTVIGMGKVVPAVKILELAFMFESYREVDLVLNSTIEDFRELARSRGVELLSFLEGGFVYLFSKTPVRTKQDLKDLKMWIWLGDPIFEEVAKSFGVKLRINLPLTDVYLALATGLIDAALCTPYFSIALKWHEQTSFVVVDPIAYVPGGIVVTSRVFNALSPDLREVMVEVASEVSRELNPKLRAENERALEVLVEKGVKPISFDRKVLDDMKSYMREVMYEKFSGEFYPPELLQKVRSILSQNRGRR